MRVLMVNTPASVHFKGGDTTQMVKTAEALRGRGVDVTISYDAEPNAVGFDVAHVFNLRTITVTARQVRALKRTGIPIVMSPIYLNPSLALWGSRVSVNVFTKAKGPQELDGALDDFRDRKLWVKQRGDVVVAADRENRAFGKYDERQREILREVAHLLPNSYLEMAALARTLQVTHIPFTVVPYAADSSLFLNPDPAPFIAKHGVRDFVLQVGRIEAPKNQLMLAYALRDFRIPLVFVGSALQRGYLSLCRRFGPKNLTIIPHLPPEELRSAYAAARVHALPSWMETCGLVTMEAALGGCSAVVSIAGYEVEYYRDLVYYCDPADVGSIRRAVLEAFQNQAQDQPRRQRLQELILTEYTWERAAELTREGYCRTLERRQDTFRMPEAEGPIRKKEPHGE